MINIINTTNVLTNNK